MRVVCHLFVSSCRCVLYTTGLSQAVDAQSNTSLCAAGEAVAEPAESLFDGLNLPSKNSGWLGLLRL
jgi:hypothetical protein